jgi:aminoglycoside phosphotransferase family enzyme
MDLDFRRRRDAAGRVLNAYLDEAAGRSAKACGRAWPPCR